MNISYNNKTEFQKPELFKLMDEFVYTHLKDKSLFNKITIFQFKYASGFNYGFAIVNDGLRYKIIDTSFNTI
ncbi:MAG: hypothetical protein ABRQ25_14815 [Clostridiaceae bacterium]